MNRTCAEQVIEALTRASSLVASTIDQVRLEVDGGDFKKYAAAAGEVLGAIQLDLMGPVLREYPDLDPDS